MAGGRGQTMAAVLLGVLLVVVPSVVVTSAADPYTRPKIILLWVGVALVVGWFVAGGGVVEPIAVVDVALGAFVAWVAVATVFSVDPWVSLIGERLHYQGLATTVLYAGFFVVARGLGADPAVRVRLLEAAVAGVGLVALYAVGQHVGVDPYWGDRIVTDRVFGSLGQPNALAAYLATGLAPAIWLLGGKRRCGQAIGLVTTVAALLAVLWSESRGAYLAVAAVLPFAIAGAVQRVRSRQGALTRLQRRVGVVGGLLGAGLFGVIAVGGGFDEPVDRFATIFEGRSEISARDHWDQWTVAVHLVGEHPLVGTGPDTFPLVFPEASREVLDDEAVRNFDQYRVESPHNAVLAIAAGSGLPAVIAWLFTLGAIVWLHVRAALEHPAHRPTVALVVATMAGFVLTSLFITADTTATWLFWLLMGLGLAGSTTSQRSGT